MSEAETTFSDQARVAAALAAVEAPSEGEVIDAPLPEEPEPAAAEPETPEAEAAPEETAEETETPTEPAPVQDAELAPRLAAISRREAKQREQHKTQQAEIEQQKVDLRERMAKLEAYEKAVARAQSDPVALFESLGITEGFDNIAAQIWHKQLGEDAPAEFKEQQRYRTVEARINELEKRHQEELAEQKKLLEHSQLQQQVREFDAKNETFLKGLGDDYPHLKAVVSNDLGEAMAGMTSVAMQLMEAEPGRVPSPAELASHIEGTIKQNMAQFGHLYAPKNGKPADEDSPPPKPVTTTTATKTRKPALTDAERIQRAKQAYYGD